MFECPKCRNPINSVLGKGEDRETKIWVCISCRKFYRIIPARIEELDNPNGVKDGVNELESSLIGSKEESK